MVTEKVGERGRKEVGAFSGLRGAIKEKYLEAGSFPCKVGKEDAGVFGVAH